MDQYQIECQLSGFNIQLVEAKQYHRRQCQYQYIPRYVADIRPAHHFFDIIAYLFFVADAHRLTDDGDYRQREYTAAGVAETYKYTLTYNVLIASLIFILASSV